MDCRSSYNEAFSAPEIWQICFKRKGSGRGSASREDVNKGRGHDVGLESHHAAGCALPGLSGWRGAGAVGRWLVVCLPGFLLAWLLDLQDTRDPATVREDPGEPSKSLLDVSAALASRVRRPDMKPFFFFWSRDSAPSADRARRPRELITPNLAILFYGAYHCNKNICILGNLVSS